MYSHGKHVSEYLSTCVAMIVKGSCIQCWLQDVAGFAYGLLQAAALQMLSSHYNFIHTLHVCPPCGGGGVMGHLEYLVVELCPPCILLHDVT